MWRGRVRYSRFPSGMTMGAPCACMHAPAKQNHFWLGAHWSSPSPQPPTYVLLGFGRLNQRSDTKQDQKENTKKTSNKRKKHWGLCIEGGSWALFTGGFTAAIGSPPAIGACEARQMPWGSAAPSHRDGRFAASLACVGTHQGYLGKQNIVWCFRFKVFGRYLVRDVFHWIQVAETSNLLMFVRLQHPRWSVLRAFIWVLQPDISDGSRHRSHTTCLQTRLHTVELNVHMGSWYIYIYMYVHSPAHQTGSARKTWKGLKSDENHMKTHITVIHVTVICRSSKIFRQL